MGSDRNLANTVGGKSARACDNCISKRARWYCAADDAFLCQGCDASVHLANPLARRHERVRLKTSSFKPSNEASTFPSWHHGFTRKARTPRFNKNGKFKNERKARNPNHLVPELCSDETSHEENEEQLLYRVPIFDRFVANSNEAIHNIDNDEQSKASLYDFHGSLPSEMELEEFAADVDTLLGKGLEDESFDIESLGLMEFSMGNGQVKIEDYGEFDDAPEFDSDIGPFDFNYDDNTLVQCDMIAKASEDCEENDVKKKTNILLRLDYDSVITAWDEQRSPWTNNGERPQLNTYDWPYCVANGGSRHQFEEVGLTRHAPMEDKGREARVSRYREKRRRRLFSKKIRYEVRKLNAEKRPRMKGRFVKRANFATSDFPLLNK